MIRRLLFATILTTSTAVGVFAAHPATFVMRNGDRISGELTYKGGTDYTLGGRDIPSDQIAVISFGGDPSAAEIRQVPAVDNNPNELERHVFVTRSGQVIFGKIYKFSPDGESVTFDQREGGRKEMSSNDIARIYVNPGAARNVYANLVNSPASPAAGVVATNGVANSVTVTVPGNQQWVATGLNVRARETYRFNTSGEIQFTSNPNDRAVSAGSLAQSKVPGAPIPGALAGALIGRIDNGAPFGIGNNATVQMPAKGQLFLGINDDNVSDNSGAFTVSIQK